MVVAVATTALIAGSVWFTITQLFDDHSSGNDEIRLPSAVESSRAITGRFGIAPARKSDIRCEPSGSSCLAWAWQSLERYRAFGAPTVAGRQTYVGVGAFLLQLETGDGSPTWRGSLEADLRMAPVVNDELIVVADDDARIYAFDRNQRQRLWTVSLGPGTPVDVVAVRDLIVASMLTSDGSGRIVALGAKDGVLVWQHPVTGSPSPFSVDPGVERSARIFVANEEGDVMAIDAAEGELLWTANDVGRELWWLVEQDSLVALHEEGRLSAVGAAGGEILWQVPVSAGVPIAYVPRWNRFMMIVATPGIQLEAGSDLFLEALDAATGTRRGRYPTGPLRVESPDTSVKIAGSDRNGWLYLSTGDGLAVVHPATGEVIGALEVPSDQRLTLGSRGTVDVEHIPLPVTTGRAMYAVKLPETDRPPLIVAELDEGQTCPDSPMLDLGYGQVVVPDQRNDETGITLRAPSVAEGGAPKQLQLFDLGELEDHLLVRGVRLDGDGRAGFRSSQDAAFSERLYLDDFTERMFVSDRGLRSADQMPSHWLVDTHFPSHGCWGIQVDTASSTYTFVIEVAVTS